MLQNTPSAQMLESTSQSSPGILILGGLEFLAVPPFCPIQATLQTARLESMSSMGGREPCLILGLALQALYQTPSCAPWNPFRRAGCQPSIKWDVCGVGRGGAPHFPISVQSHVSRKTGYSWSHSIDGSMTFLSPCTYHSEVTVPCWHCHKLSLTQVIAHPGSSEPDFPPPPCKSYTCSRVCLQHGCPTTLYTDIMSFVVPTICCCLSTQ